MIEIKEGIEFDGFNSKEHNLFLIERDAPSPEEREVVEVIPYSQGVYDFSMLYGDRPFNNRIITYEFLAVDLSYHDRKPLERELKRQLMVGGKNRLYDSHDSAYYWLGKCKSVVVNDDHEFNCLRATIQFDVYPYLFGRYNYFDDLTANAHVDNVAQWTKHVVKFEKEIMIINDGDRKVNATINVASEPAPRGHYRSVFTPAEELRVYIDEANDRVLVGTLAWSEAQGVGHADSAPFNDITRVKLTFTDGTSKEPNASIVGVRLIDGVMYEIIGGFGVYDELPSVSKVVSEIEMEYYHDTGLVLETEGTASKTLHFDEPIVARDAWFDVDYGSLRESIDIGLISRADFEQIIPGVLPSRVMSMTFGYKRIHTDADHTLTLEGGWFTTSVVLDGDFALANGSISHLPLITIRGFRIYDIDVTYRALVSRGTTERIGYEL